MVLIGDKVQVEARFGPHGDSANLDSRQVHGLRRTYHRLIINLDAPDGTPRLQGSCGTSLRSVWRQC
jgi:hypothetical protein